MIHPTIEELTGGQYNRYQLTIATAKCARLITDEYAKQRSAAESTLAGTKEGSSTIASLIDPVLANEKAVKTAIGRISDKEFVIVDAPEAAQIEEGTEEAAEEATEESAED